MSTTRFSLLSMLRSRAFVLTTLLLTVCSSAFATNRLTGLLGFDYSLYFGAVATLVLGYFAWAASRQRTAAQEGPAFLGTVVRIWLAALLALVPPLLVICLNAFRVRNCNFATGFLYFAIFPGVGSVLSVALGVALSMLRGRVRALLLLFFIPLGSIAWAVYQGLTHPPIFAYGHFFGYYPGTIYDELREITSTLLLFRLQTIAWALAILSGVALVAGRDGRAARIFDWRRALVRRDPSALDGRWQWGTDREGAVGTLALLLLCVTWLVTTHVHRHTIGYKQTDASIQEDLGGRYETPHFVLYYDRDHVNALTLRKMARDAEFRFHQLTQFFGHRPRRKVEVYWFANVKQKARLMGAAHTMIARPWAYQFYIHGYYSPHNVLKHELAHVFSAAFGAGPLKLSVRHGVFFYPALIEGVAVAADWVRGELSPHEWSRAMLDLKVAPDPQQILGPRGFFRYSGWTAYTIAGSFSRYLIDRYGIEKYKQAYGEARFARVYNKPLRQLSNEWKSHLRRTVKLSDHDRKRAAYRFRRYRSIFVRTCPHTIAALSEKVSRLSSSGAYYTAAKVQSRVCQYAPRAHQRLRLVRLTIKAHQYDRADLLLKRLLADYPVTQSPINHARIRLQAGLLALRQKQWEVARRHYQLAAQQQLSFGEIRHIQVVLYALQHANIRHVILDYLYPQESQTAGLLQLQAAALRNPTEPMLAYLLGRRLYFTKSYENARPLLQTAEAGLSTLSLQAESLRLRALCFFHKGSYRKAATLFASLAQKPLPSGLRRQALDWRQRALWEKSTYQKPPTRDPIPTR